MNTTRCDAAPGSGATAPAQARGVTLIELMMGLAVLAVLCSLAVPAMGLRLERQRLALAAETLAADMTEARFEAARRGMVMRVQAISGSGGHGWCWSVAPSGAAPTADCGCAQARNCGHRSVPAIDHPGVKMRQGHVLELQPDGTASAATVAEFESPSGERVRVDIGALGRSRICSPAGAPGPGVVGRYPPC